jgi:hypothetical protein
MCRKDLTVKDVPKKATTPIRQEPQPSESSQESWRQITYQEFIDTIAQSNSHQQNTIIEVRAAANTPRTQPRPKSESNIEKFLKIILMLCALAIIFVIIWL